MTHQSTTEQIKTVLEMDVTDTKGNLISRQETYIPIIRVGSQNGLEITIAEQSLSPVHMVFHIMSDNYACVDLPFEFPPTYFSTVTRPNKKLLRTPKVWKLEKDSVISVLGYNFTITDISQLGVEELKNKLQAKVDKDVAASLMQMGIIFTNESELTIEQRYVVDLVRKLSVFANGMGSANAQLASATRSVVMKANTILNSTNISSEFLFRTVVAQNAYLRDMHKVLKHFETFGRMKELPEFPTNLVYTREDYLEHVQRIVADLERTEGRQQSAEDVIANIEANKRRSRIHIVEDPPNEGN